MKVFVDTNVLLDVLIKRSAYYEDAAVIWALAEDGTLDAFISAISFNNVYYITRREMDRKQALKAISILRDVFQVVPLGSQLLNQAIDAGLSDFEDAIQYHSAIHSQAEYLITRNPKDFPTDVVRIISPQEFMTLPLVDER